MNKTKHNALLKYIDNEKCLITNKIKLLPSIIIINNYLLTKYRTEITFIT